MMGIVDIVKVGAVLKGKNLNFDLKEEKKNIRRIVMYDYYNYCPGLDLNGGKYLGITEFVPDESGWIKLETDSSEFSSWKKTGHLTDEEMENFLDKWYIETGEPYIDVIIDWKDGREEYVHAAKERKSPIGCDN